MKNLRMENRTGGRDVGKKKKWLAVVELLAVLLITAAAFVWGRRTAFMERGYLAYGGEYMFLLFPFLYYIGKAMR